MEHPFAGGKKTKGVTLKHVPLIWENMLGTVYGMDAQRNTEYFDYNYDAARKFADVAGCTDLRICKNKWRGRWANDKGDISGPRYNQIALWGVRRT